IVRPDRQPVVACVDRGMIRPEGRSRRGPHMSATPDSTLADPERLIADLQRQLAERTAERDEALAERLKVQRKLAEATAERDEALERQTATAEVVEVINSSPGDLQPVFEAILDKAMRRCGAGFGHLQTFDGERWYSAAEKGVPKSFAEFRKNNPPPYGPRTISARILEGEPLVHTVDLMAEELYRIGDPNRRALVDLAGARSSLVVP